ncbi:hypothetical protein [Leptothoe kymatousa]|uniref:Uncharacterized protein n=1 Tax=Leptothoe kymatousa TAU-MAC 1615 TaxID=2364775 RepID=A0ABS5Y1Y3_9CYAN|nr:hypothetical protein [Leptothoe kymatousa]MBT9311843.1 hypothetical protein [Leptothoe kymatousa TAU-MAC 1615]
MALLRSLIDIQRLIGIMEDVKIAFFKFLNGEIPVQEFEPWIYGAVDVLADVLDGYSSIPRAACSERLYR